MSEKSKLLKDAKDVPNDAGSVQPLEVDEKPYENSNIAVRVFHRLGDSGRTVVGAVLAVGIGAICQAADAHDETTFRVIGLPGDVWLNALRLVVLPLIVANMIVAVAMIGRLPNGGKLGSRVVLYYMCSTFFAVALSLLICNTILIPNMSKIDLPDEPEDPEDAPPDVNAPFLDQVESILFGLVPANIINAAATNNLMGVIVFSIVVGLCIRREDSTFLKFFEELSEISMVLVMKLIAFTPIGVFSLILPQVATSDLAVIAQYLGLLLGCLGLGIGFHTLVALPTILYMFTRKNPVPFFLNLIPAHLTAFGTSSSAATLPVTTMCAVEKNHLDPIVADFVLPIGATVNMDGTAIKYPLMVVWLAYAQEMSFGPMEFVILAIVCCLTSMGSAPIPTAGLALWVLVLEAVGVPINGLIGIVFSMEWLVDRMETVCNITSDSVCCGIMDKYYPMSEEVIRARERGDPV